MNAADRRAAIVAHVHAHPGCVRRAIVVDTDLSRGHVNRCVDRAIGLGLLTEDDNGRLYAVDTGTVTPTKRGLVADGRKLVVERRRDDCANLSACEWEWVEAHGSAQAKCRWGARGSRCVRSGARTCRFRAVRTGSCGRMVTGG